MENVNEVVKRKLEKYDKRSGELALKAIELAEKYRNEASVAEHLASVVRSLARGKK